MQYRDVMRWLGHQRWFAWTAAKAAPLDAKVLKKTGGRFGLLGNYGLPQCLVTTTGRKSGQKRTVTLLYGELGDEVLLAGTNFGQKHHPAWALNLEADLHATIEIDGVAKDLVARMVTDETERDQVWEVFYSIWPAYGVYEGRSGRDIKLFALAPAS